MTSIAPPSAHPWAKSIAEAVDRYHEILAAYVDKGGEDHLALLDRMVQRGAVFAGRPLCTFLRPQFVLKPQFEAMAETVKHFRSAVVKAKDAILADAKLLELIALSDGERRLLAMSPEYKSVGVITRLDTIVDGDDIQLVELNADATFGGLYSDRLSDLFEGFQPLREFARTRHATAMYAGSSLVGAILDTFHEFGGTRVPRVAVVDWKEVATFAEFDLVCERFHRHGIPARFVDPRDLEWKDGELSANGQGIDLVYRRLLMSDMLAREAECRPLVDAYKARGVCVVNSFRAKVLDKKILFALLHEPQIQALFDADELRVVRRNVPWTRRVCEGKTTGPDGQTIDLLEWAARHPKELVLKPNDDYAGRGVLLGQNVEPSVWERQLKMALHDPSILQKRVSLPSAMFPEVGAAGELFFSRRFIELDPYLFRGEACGTLTRLSATTMCNLHQSAGTAPTFLLDA